MIKEEVNNNDHHQKFKGVQSEKKSIVTLTEAVSSFKKVIAGTAKPETESIWKHMGTKKPSGKVTGSRHTS